MVASKSSWRRVNAVPAVVLGCLIVLVTLPLAASGARADAFEDPTSAETVLRTDLTETQFSNEFYAYLDQGYRFEDIEVDYDAAGQRVYSARWRINDGRGWYLWRNMTSEDLWARYNEYVELGYRMVDIEVYQRDGGTRYAGVWAQNVEGVGWAVYREMNEATWSAYESWFRAAGYCITDFEAYQIDGQRYYAAIWITSDSGPDILARAMSWEEFSFANALLTAFGFRVVEMEKYPVDGVGKIAAVWLPNSNGRAWTFTSWWDKAVFDEERRKLEAKGYRATNYTFDVSYGYAATFRQNSQQQIDASLWNAIQQHQGEVTFFVQDLASGNSFEFLPDEQRYLASVGKIAVLAELYRQVDLGLRDPTTQVQFTADFYQDEGHRLTAANVGQWFSLQQLASFMVGVSDNTAHEMLLDVLGQTAVNNAMLTLGFADFTNSVPYRSMYRAITTQLDPRFATEPIENIMSWINGNAFFPLTFVPNIVSTSYVEQETLFVDATTWNNASARSVASVFGRVAQGTLWNANVSSQIRALLPTGTPFCNSLPAGWRCVRKNGGWNDVLAHAGYVLDPSGTARMSFAVFHQNLAPGVDHVVMDATIGAAAFNAFGF